MKQATVIVTGASQGLGAGIASIAADQGAHVVLTARSEPALELQAQKIRQRGGSALPIVGDVTRFEDCQRIIELSLRTFGGIDALVNNAATIEMHRYFISLYEQGKLLAPERPALAAVSVALKAPVTWSGEILEWDDERVQGLVGLL